jgi:hypothetical protein
MPALYLEKRDNMGYAIPPAAIILLILVGAGGCVCVGFAIHRLMGAADADHGYRARTAEQEDYMREVRTRNLHGLMVEGRPRMKGGYDSR